MPATPIAARARSRSCLRHGVREDLLRLGGERLEPLLRRRVVVEVALGLAHDAGLRRDVELDLAVASDDELGRAAADVDDDDLLSVDRPLARRAGERQRGLLVAADRAGVQVEPIAHRRRELCAVGRVADGAREHRGRRGRAVLVDELAEVPERVEDALHRRVREPAGRVDALAEPGHDRLAMKLRDSPVIGDVGDEQPRGVRPDVDDGDAHGAGGYPGRRGWLRRETVAKMVSPRRGVEQSGSSSGS